MLLLLKNKESEVIELKKNIVGLLFSLGVILVGMTGCGEAKDTGQGTAQSTIETVADKSGKEDSETNQETVADSGTDVKAENQLDDHASDSGETNILIAYFSHAGENYNVGVIEKGNTEILAEMVAEITGGDLFEIKTVNEYPTEYKACTDVAKQELNDKARPELAASVDNMDQYSVCFLCYPIWWGNLPMAAYSFLDEYDWSGKTIITLNTHEGSGKAGTPDKISKYLSGATVIDGLAIQGATAQNSQDSARAAIEEWLAELGY